MSRVWLRMAGTSEATKYSPLPRPMTTGGPSRAATILFGSLRLEDGEREDAAELLDGAADSAFQIAFEIFFDQMRDDFGVGFGLEDVAFALELFLQRQEVFDDAVVDDDDVAGAVAVRMGVFFGGAAVRGPAGMADAVVAIDRIEAQDVFEVAKFTRRAADAEGLIVAVDGDARGIIAAVFEAFQAIQNDRNGALRAHIADNSAHKFIVRNGGLEGRFALVIPGLGPWQRRYQVSDVPGFVCCRGIECLEADRGSLATQIGHTALRGIHRDYA